MHAHITHVINSLLREKNISATELSEATGISNGTISKLRNGSYLSDISFSMILKVCAYFEIPVEIMVPPNQKIKNQTFVTFHDSATAEGSSIHHRYLEMSLKSDTLYICDTIPEPVKTYNILRAEVGDLQGLRDYANAMALTRSSPKFLNGFFGTIFMDTGVLTDLLNAQGIYTGLKQDDIEEQTRLISDFLDSTFPRVHACVVDFKKNELSTCFVVDKRFGTQFQFGGYLEWNCSELGAHIHRKAVRAMKNAVTFNQFLASRSC